MSIEYTYFLNIHKPFNKMDYIMNIEVSLGAFLVAQLVKNPPAMQETPVLLMGREDPLVKG